MESISDRAKVSGTYLSKNQGDHRLNTLECPELGEVGISIGDINLVRIAQPILNPLEYSEDDFTRVETWLTVVYGLNVHMDSIFL
jgi:hypothetical protein